MTAQQVIEKCNEECRRCQEDFQKSGVEFRSSMCKLCPTGQKLHEALKKTNQAEKQWDNIDWNSSRWKDFYHG